MYLSKSGRIYTKERADTQPIYLIYQYFVHHEASRNKELQDCLRKNVENPHITKIYLLNEKIYDKKELGIDSSKIEQRNIVSRIKFKDVFNFVEKESLKGYIVTCNADIFFDKTIDNLRKSTMSTKKQLLAQLRFDYTNKQLGKCKLFGPRADSQDAWIWHSNFNPNKEEIISMSECLEIPVVLILDLIIFLLFIKFISIELFCKSKFKIFPLFIKKLIFLSLSDFNIYFISVDKFLILIFLVKFKSAFKSFAFI